VDESQGQRTEKPTQRKKQKAREKGKVAKSPELTSACVILGGIIALRLLFPWLVSETSGFACKFFGTTPLIESAADVETVAVGAILGATKILAPFLLAMLGVALVSNYVQVGFLFSTQPLAPSLDKINPVAGFKRLFSMRSVVKLGINCAKAAFVGIVFYYSIRASMDRYYSLGDCGIRDIVNFMGKESFSISIKAALILGVLGLADYAYQHSEHIKSLMMSKHELKEEFKEIEGSPLIRSRIKAAQRELARRRMMNAVPTADVVVTNPVHLAVAIKYDGESMLAPTVVAKGKRLIAERIKEIAREHGVPVIENRPLAQSLYELVEIGSEIPESLYKAVAEILSYVYRLKGNIPSIVRGHEE
jgi:flagellar biosynthetic protein FlhB